MLYLSNNSLNKIIVISNYFKQRLCMYNGKMQYSSIKKKKKYEIEQNWKM